MAGSHEGMGGLGRFYMDGAAAIWDGDDDAGGY